jgi:hypothetical protein
LLKSAARLENRGQQEVEESPQLWQFILEWGACEEQSVRRQVVSVEDLSQFAVVVLHSVTLVNNHVLPAQLQSDHVK